MFQTVYRCRLLLLIFKIRMTYTTITLFLNVLYMYNNTHIYNHTAIITFNCVKYLCQQRGRSTIYYKQKQLKITSVKCVHIQSTLILNNNDICHNPFTSYSSVQHDMYAAPLLCGTCQSSPGS